MPRGLITTTQSILASAARAASGSSNSFKIRSTENIRVYIDVTLVGAPGTLDVTIQTSPDNSKWYTVTTMSTISATGQYTGSGTVMGQYMRISYTIGGGGNFTFSAQMTKNNPVS